MAVIEAARLVVPRIRARSGAPMGLRLVLDDSQVVETLLARDKTFGHLVLCRTNAPLGKSKTL